MMNCNFEAFSGFKVESVVKCFGIQKYAQTIGFPDL